MTRKEKISILKDIIDGEIVHPQVRRDVGIWAIKELEQEPCDDVVSRQEVKEVFPRWKFLSYEAYLCAVAEIDALSSVRPQEPTGQ